MQSKTRQGDLSLEFDHDRSTRKNEVIGIKTIKGRIRFTKRSKIVVGFVKHQENATYGSG